MYIELLYTVHVYVYWSVFQYKLWGENEKLVCSRIQN